MLLHCFVEHSSLVGESIQQTLGFEICSYPPAFLHLIYTRNTLCHLNSYCVKNEHDFEHWICFSIGRYVTLTFFPFFLHFLLQFKHLPGGGSTFCASAQLSHHFYVEMEGRSRQRTWNPGQRQRDRWKELGALSRHMQCMRDLQFRDISVNNLGNSVGQSLLKSQAYGRNWKKI